MNMLKRVLPTLLIVLIAMVGCKDNKYNFDDLGEPVKSFFMVKGTEFKINEAIEFANGSESAETYLWDFGDGTSSKEKAPLKTYTAPGVYTVKLKAVGAGGTGNYSVDLAVIDPDAVIDTDKELFFIEYGSKLIRKVSLVPGSAAETVISMTGKEGHGMAYDAVNEKIYYCDFQNSGSGKVWRMNADGSNVEELLSGLGAPYGVAVNLADNKMYIADGTNVSRANLDGSGYEKEFIKVVGGSMRAIGFNSKTGFIYYYDVNEENLHVAKADGTGGSILIAGAYGYGMYVDEINEKIYYDDRNAGGLMRAELNGSGVVKIATFSGNRGGSGMTVDHTANKIYWAETNNGIIKKANLDGTEIETVLSGVNNPRGMFVK
ncbi:PKD domain-containing protein [Sphingobacterium tabacisoli]|uniref:PKD domain-containing protein n=1 Tax=Sphingobacterium tabacisoli TaxID=2044855 RepID=A0ABW5KVT8_9SPHI|nr:PKD domain-containing protein [Sphingobacterium tabacisoli]